MAQQKGRKTDMPPNKTYFDGQNATFNLATEIKAFSQKRYLEAYPNAKFGEALFIAMQGSIGIQETADLVTFMI